MCTSASLLFHQQQFFLLDLTLFFLESNQLSLFFVVDILPCPFELKLVQALFKLGQKFIKLSLNSIEAVLNFVHHFRFN